MPSNQQHRLYSEGSETHRWGAISRSRQLLDQLGRRVARWSAGPGCAPEHLQPPAVHSLVVGSLISAQQSAKGGADVS
jgi:hypothetical protein